MRSGRAGESTATPVGAKRTGATRAASGAPVDPADVTARAVLDAFRSVARGMRAGAVDDGSTSGLAAFPARLRALRQLASGPAVSLKELAERTHTDPSSASVVVQHLVERGLVTRRRDAGDRRRMSIALTAAGRSAIDRAPAAVSTRVAGALHALSERQRATLARLLDALARELAAPDAHE